LFTNEVIGEIGRRARRLDLTAQIEMGESGNLPREAPDAAADRLELLAGRPKSVRPPDRRLRRGIGDVRRLENLAAAGDCGKTRSCLSKTPKTRSASDQFLYNMRALGAIGILRGLKGILFAKPADIAPDKWSLYDQTLKQVTAEFDRPDMPIVTQMDFGHTDPIFVLPMGAMATIDPVHKRFSIDEPGCK
jgi:hypothetical protein